MHEIGVYHVKQHQAEGEGWLPDKCIQQWYIEKLNKEIVSNSNKTLISYKNWDYQKGSERAVMRKCRSELVAKQ